MCLSTRLSKRPAHANSARQRHEQSQTEPHTTCTCWSPIKNNYHISGTTFGGLFSRDVYWRRINVEKAVDTSAWNRQNLITGHHAHSSIPIRLSVPIFLSATCRQYLLTLSRLHNLICCLIILSVNVRIRWSTLFFRLNKLCVNVRHWANTSIDLSYETSYQTPIQTLE